MKIHLVFLATILTVIISACGGSGGPDIRIEDPWVRAATMMEMQRAEGMSSGGEMESHIDGGNSAAYMTIHNNGGEGDRLIKVDSDVAEAVEIHISEIIDDVMTMHPVEGVDVPARGQAELKPGGLHVMLIGLKRDLNAGDKVKLSLAFEKSGEIVVEAEVRTP